MMNKKMAILIMMTKRAMKIQIVMIKRAMEIQIVMITRQNKTLTLYTYSIYGTVLAPLTTVTLLKDTNKAFGEIPESLDFTEQIIIATRPEPTVRPPSRTQAVIFIFKNPLFWGFFSRIYSIFSLKAACFRIFKVKIRSHHFLRESSAPTLFFH